MVNQLEPGTYFHCAFATNQNGENFSLTEFNGAMYVGRIVNNSAEEITDYKSYSWYLIVPEESVTEQTEAVNNSVANDMATNQMANEERITEARMVATDYIEDDGSTATFGASFDSVIVGDASAGHISIDSDSVDIFVNGENVGSFGIDEYGRAGLHINKNGVDTYLNNRFITIRESDTNYATIGLDYGFVGAINQNFQVTEHNVITSKNITAEGYTEGTITATNVNNGYYPLGIVGWSSSTRYFALTRAYLTNRSIGQATVNYMVSNHHSSAHSASMTVYVLWCKGV